MQRHRLHSRVLSGAALLLVALLLSPSLQARPRSAWPGYRSRQLSKSLPRKEARTRLRQVRDTVRSMVRQGKRPTVVFDIDDTLVKGQTPGGSGPPT